MFPEMFGYVLCCIPEETQKALRNPNADLAFIRRAQENLTREKHGYRCSKCGRYFPDVQLLCRDAAEDARPYAKLPCKASKCKKAADVFCTSHYYAKNSNALLKFEVDAEHNARQTDSIPIRRDVCHIITSPDEKYIATETFSGTIDIIDTQMKLPVAHRQRTGTNGAFLFTVDHKLLYFIKAPSGAGILSGIRIRSFFRFRSFGRETQSTGILSPSSVPASFITATRTYISMSLQPE